MPKSSQPLSFLVYNDFKYQIQNDDLLQLIGACTSPSLTNCCISYGGFPYEWTDLTQYTQNVLIQGENQAVAEVSSYLSGRYLTNEIFAPTQQFDLTLQTTYFGKNLIYYNYPYFSSAITYSIGSYFSWQGIVYSASTQINSGTTNPLSASTNAGYVTEQDALYYANLPVPEWNNNTSYKQGNVVWYQDNLYQAKSDIYGIHPATSMNLELRYGIPSAQQYLGYFTLDYDQQPYTNPVSTYGYMPRVNTNYWQLYNGPANWFTGTTYYFSGVDPTMQTEPYWIKGDNRNAQVVLYLIDVILYHLHSRINPRNIPEIREIRYNGGEKQYGKGGVIGWLLNVQKGNVSLNVPEIQPVTGQAIRFGSYPKNSNSF
jgi:hypothetical protein